MHENEGKNDMLKFIAATVETLRDQMATLRDQMAAMGGQMATMVTKSELRQLEEHMATKSELRRVEERMATKSELRRLEEKMEAGFTAVRGDIERVALRLDTIDRALSA